MSDYTSDSDIDMEPCTNAASIGAWSHLRHPELIVPEAFEDHPLRLQRQLASATGTDLQRVVATLQEICGDAPALADLREYARVTLASFYLYKGGRLVEAVPLEDRDHHNPAIVVAEWCGNTYFYKGIGHHDRWIVVVAVLERDGFYQAAAFV